MDNSRHSNHYDAKKAFVKLSRSGCLLFIAIFLCSLVAVALIVYNFATCHQDVLSKSHFPLNDDKVTPTLSLTTSDKEDENDEAKRGMDLRLPRSVKPISYDIALLPFLTTDNFTFNGEVTIKIQILETCKNVTLHAYSLQIIWSQSQIQKLDSDGYIVNVVENISIHNQYFVEEKQFFVLETTKQLKKDSFYIVKLHFVGTIKDNLQGFYKSSYKAGSETRWLASTQFQATDARR